MAAKILENHPTWYGPQRYEYNWYAVRARRIELVERAVAGDTEAVDALRVMILHAGVFAILSVRQQVTNHEQNYAAWLRGEPITGLPIHRIAAASVGAWIATDFDLSLFEDMSGRTLIDSLIRIHGLGPAKSTFMAALLGYDDCPCIDMHMARIFDLPSQYSSLKTYRATLATTPLRHTLAQWRAFLCIARFAVFQHDIYFQTVLGDAAMVAA